MNREDENFRQCTEYIDLLVYYKHRYDLKYFVNVRRLYEYRKKFVKKQELLDKLGELERRLE